MQKIDGGLSAKLANMAWVCAVFVVYIHVWQLARRMDVPATAPFWFFEGTLTACAVPFFFFSAGWFLGGHVSEPGWYGRALKSRCRTVLVPFLLISAIDLIGTSAVTVARNVSDGRCWCDSLSWMGILTGMGLNPCAFPGHQVFWFLRSMLLVVLASPVLVWLLTGAFRTGGRPVSRWRGWIVTGLILIGHGLLSACVRNPQDPWPDLYRTTLNTASVSMMTLGLWMRVAGTPLVGGWRRTLGWWGLAAAAGLVLYTGVLPAFLGRAFGSVQVIALFLALLGSMPPVRFPFAWTSFPVYAIHTFFFTLLLMLGMIPQSPGLSDYLASGVFLAVVSTAFAYALRRYFPRLASVLFGGRGDER